MKNYETVTFLEPKSGKAEFSTAMSTVHVAISTTVETVPSREKTDFITTAMSCYVIVAVHGFIYYRTVPNDLKFLEPIQCTTVTRLM